MRGGITSEVHLVPRSFEYFAPSSVKEATELLKKYNGEAKVLAGGMSLIPVMKLRLASPECIVDINGIEDLAYIKEAEGRLLIGALTRHHAIETSSLLREKALLLPETAGWIGDPQVRNLGTMGGSLAHSDPSGDWAAAILAMRGEMKLSGPGGERRVTIDEFLVDTFTSALQPDEILCEIAVPTPPTRSGGAYKKLERKAGDFATAAVAAQISLDASGACTYAGIGLTALGPKNLRGVKAEKALVGREITQGVIEEAAAAAMEDSQPISDPLRGSAEYKREMAKVFTKRALTQAWERARGGKAK